MERSLKYFNFNADAGATMKTFACSGVFLNAGNECVLRVRVSAIGLGCVGVLREIRQKIYLH